MRDLADHIAAWYQAGVPFALATLVKARGSAPRQVGACMAVNSTGSVVGSISGGCVEGALYQLAERVIETSEPAIARYGFGNDDEFSVGLTCGGDIEVFVQRIGPGDFPELGQIAQLLRTQSRLAIATVIDVQGSDPRAPRAGDRLMLWPDRGHGMLGTPRLTEAVVADALGHLEHGHTGLMHIGADGERRHDDLTILVQSFAPRPHMYIFGAIDYAAALTRVGRFLGYHVTVCDARPVFARAERFPDADEVVVAWPHEFLCSHPPDDRTVIAVLTHDPKFDVPLLEIALRTNAAYVGAMGSRRTHDGRVAQLRNRGLTSDELARLRAPIGLDLGARTPEETAVSIAAEIVALRWGATGLPLATLDTPIHRDMRGDRTDAPAEPRLSPARTDQNSHNRRRGR